MINTILIFVCKLFRLSPLQINGDGTPISMHRLNNSMRFRFTEAALSVSDKVAHAICEIDISGDPG